MTELCRCVPRTTDYWVGGRRVGATLHDHRSTRTDACPLCGLPLVEEKRPDNEVEVMLRVDDDLMNALIATATRGDLSTGTVAFTATMFMAFAFSRFDENGDILEQAIAYLRRFHEELVADKKELAS